MRTRSARSLVASLAASLIVASSAHATVYTYTASLSGPAEFPVNASPGTGSATVLYDDVAHTLLISASFSGLLGNTTQAHIHAVVPNPPMNPTAGVAVSPGSLTGFPIGVTSGSMPPTLFNLTNASSFTNAFVTANGGTLASAEAALIASMNNSPPHPTLPSRAYFNIHTNSFPGGEIRGFLTLVPEPTTIALGAFAVVGLAVLRRRFV